MVSNSALAAVCVWSGLHQYLLFESPYLENSIRSYASELEVRQQNEYAEAKIEGRPPGQYWLDIEPPKVGPRITFICLPASFVDCSQGPFRRS